MHTISAGKILCVAVTPCLQRTLRCERFTMGEVNRIRSAIVTTGGKAVNAARVVKALGGEPIVAGFAGGETGRHLLALLDRMGIAHRFVRVASPTRVCTTVLEDVGGRVTEAAEEASVPSTAELEDLRRKVAALLARCRVVIIAGALPPRCPPRAYEEMAGKAVRCGVPVIIDTHGEPLLRALAPRPLLAKLNREELGRTCAAAVGDAGRLVAAARGLIRRGARWVLVTDAGRPAWLVGACGVWTFTPPRVKVLNSVGCGDAATGGIAVGLSRGEEVPVAVRLGMACGAASATTLTPGEIDPAFVERLLPVVRGKRAARGEHG